MVAYLNKSDASEGFDQVMDFLNNSYIKTMTSLEGVDCLPNEEIFAELARMGYEKPSTKLTFYKAFFSSQWKFLIHTILQSISAKRTSWNKFSSAMASAVICLSTDRKLIFSKYIFDSLVNDVTRLQDLVDKKRVVVTEAAIREVLRLDDAEGDLLTHTTKYALPTLTQKVFTNMRRVGKGFSGVDTPLFEGMLVAQEIEEEGDADEHFKDVTAGDDAHGDDTAAHGEVPTVTQELSIPSPTPPTPLPQPPRDLPLTSQVQQTPPQSPQPQPQPQPQQPVNFPMSLLQEALDAYAALTRRVKHLEYDKVAQALEITKLNRRVKKLEKRNKGRMIAKMDKDDVVVLMDDKEEDKKVEEAKVVESTQVQGRQAESQAETYKIDMDHANKVLSMQEDETKTAEPQVPAATLFAAPARVAAAPSRRRKGVVIRDPEEESTTSIIIPETKSKDKGKWILEPKPLKKKQQIEMDEEYARKLHAELNKDINWDVAIDHVKLKAKEDLAVKRYQAMKRKPQTEAQARKNMMMYLKNVAGFKKKSKWKRKRTEHCERSMRLQHKKIAKRRKLNEEVEDLKRHLKIVPDEDDDVYTKATPLARKFPIVDYEIIKFNNKPYYKIIRADGTHQLYISFLTLLNNFDREDLEALWNLVKEKISTAKPKNFSDDFLLTTHGAMFKKPDAHAQIWKNQRTVHGQAKVKSWKLLESCALFLQLVDERLLLPPKQTPPEVDKQSCTSLLLDLLAQNGYTDERDDIINIVSLRKYSSRDTHFNPLKSKP
nr:hypothetical protein [Tanacetum cinerariifolium]